MTDAEHTVVATLATTQIGTGFSEEDLDTHCKFFADHLIPKPKPYYRYDESMVCDVWFDTVQVWEVKAADLSLSPRHQAAIGRVRAWGLNAGASLSSPTTTHPSAYACTRAGRV